MSKLKILSKIVIILLLILVIIFFDCQQPRSGGGGGGEGGDDDDTFIKPIPAGTEQTLTMNTLSIDFHYVPAATFKTGVNDSDSATINKSYWIAETEVTYELWLTVKAWATSYTFANSGVMGGGAGGKTNNHPVTYINWRDAMIFCNALTEYYNNNNGSAPDLDCVYYIDSSFTTPIRACNDDSTIDLTNGSQDVPYVKPNAKGFRLATNNEWELAARYISDKNNNGNISEVGEYYPGNYASGADAQFDATTGGVDIDNDGDVEYSTNVAVFNVSSTAEVRSKSPNKLGLYDMSGNAFEWCFDWYPGFEGTHRVKRGGTWSTSFLNDEIQVGYSSGYTPNSEDYCMNFRLVMNP